MKILIDGDACPVKNEIANIASKHNIEVLYFCSVSHYSDHNPFSNSILVDNEDQAVDMKIISYLKEKDIVITQDYGLASLVLNKGAFVLSFNGKRFTKGNIDLYLYQRYLSTQQRKMKLKTSRQRKRGKQEDLDFKHSLEKLIDQLETNPQE